MTEHHSHALHRGELLIQRRMNTPNELTDNLPRYISATMPQQHVDFYTNLPYLAVATMDKNGRPWATLLVTRSVYDPLVGIKQLNPEELEIESMNGTFDPFFRALVSRNDGPPEDVTLFAGVGVDYSNRRRNKLAGKISNVQINSEKLLQLKLKSDQHLGNCPKYITVRSLEPYVRTPDVVMDYFESFNGSLPEPAKELIARASTVYLATKHEPDSVSAGTSTRDMGLNHRGGSPGFVRLYEQIIETETIHTTCAGNTMHTYLVFPDHSGNRFYQSLGNIESDQLVGLTFPEFLTGDMLYITGIAENLYEEKAEHLMPRVNLLTRVRITGAVFVKAAIQLKMTSNEELSPYNPPVRYLRTELANIHRVQESKTLTNGSIRANLISTKRLTSTVQTFTFELSAPVDATLPGGFGIFDFSEHFDAVYRHMDEANPQAVNDDYVRTWTISSAAVFDIKTKVLKQVQQLDVTVKHKAGGAVSSFLHSHSNARNKDPSLSVEFVGIGSQFGCFSQRLSDNLPTVPPRMLWIAGGVGITPFMSMWDGIINLDRALNNENQDLVADIVLVFAGRDDDLDLLRHFMIRSKPYSGKVSLRMLAFQSLGRSANMGNASRDAIDRDFPDADIVIEQKRVDRSSLVDIESLPKREIYMCGPDGFMRHTQSLLDSIVGGKLTLHTESYSF